MRIGIGSLPKTCDTGAAALEPAPLFIAEGIPYHYGVRRLAFARSTCLRSYLHYIDSAFYVLLVTPQRCNVRVLLRDSWKSLANKWQTFSLLRQALKSLRASRVN